METKISNQELLEGILKGNKRLLSKAITLVESTLKNDQEQADELIEKLLFKTGNSLRIAITGSPGVGKSTLIEALGNCFIKNGRKVAVLAIDPTSPINKGSILGDKTRMEELSRNENAFVRPTATNLYLGGTGSKTRETILLCEAAGFDILILETVGVGQSETLVNGMVDFFLLLLQAGAGDELQGIKKGIIELASGVLVTKADGHNLLNAQKTLAEYKSAFHYLGENDVFLSTISAYNEFEIEKLANKILDILENEKKNGDFYQNRKSQNVIWLHEIIKSEILKKFIEDKKDEIANIENEIFVNNISPIQAAKSILN